MKSYFYIVIILLFFTNCTLNKVVNHHGVHFLEKKYQKIANNNTNKNDILKILGPPSTNSDFNEDIWIYIERSKTSSGITNLGKKKLTTNSIIILEFDSKGMLKDKTLIDKDDINKINFAKETTSESLRDKDLVYEVLSGIGKRIDDPLGKKKARTK